MTAYYNEIDPFAAEWLRQLIAGGHIAPGDVDERSVRDVKTTDLDGYDQHHFFAGIGVWSHALRQAGWPDDRPVWTGSCPCQPFSAAGQQRGTDDDRHLWPDWFSLISERRPSALFAEQVASGGGLAWVDTVHTDLESAGYACGAVDLCAAGVGAPHVRQRLWIVAHRVGAGLANTDGIPGELLRGRQAETVRRGAVDRVGDTLCQGLEGLAGHGDNAPGRAEQAGSAPEAGSGGSKCRVADTAGSGRDAQLPDAGRSGARGGAEGLDKRSGDGSARACTAWADVEWLHCRDGKYRPIESGTSPLVDGAPGRVGRLRGYGNAVVAPAAAEFIRAAMSCIP